MKPLWIFASLLLLASCAQKQREIPDLPDPAVELQKKASTLFGVLPEAADHNTPLARLGKQLYFETALSINRELSCNSCHPVDRYGVDNLPTSPGHEGKTGDRNSPTVYNAYFHVAQFWDGRAKDLVEQAKGPILNPVEMGMPDERMAVKRISAKKEYQQLFVAAFPGSENPISYDHMALAIAEFEKTLRTPAPFDAFVAGELSALNSRQLRGLKTFMESGCTTCHLGPGLGGNLFQKFGLVKGPYWVFTDSRLHDRGKAEVSGNAAEEFVFKVPSLRNVEKTGPYFHDGSVAGLERAVHVMGITQLGRELTEDEVKDIAAFLQSLTGEIPAHALPEKETASI